MAYKFTIKGIRRLNTQRGVHQQSQCWGGLGRKRKATALYGHVLYRLPAR